jgi:RHS repeat-associated protein
LPGSIDNYYLYGQGLISQGTVGSQDRQYYLEDGLGNIRVLTDSSGEVIEHYIYDAYGNQIQEGDTSNFKFKGEQQDSGTGLYYMRARYYDPTTGRFISRDPVDGDLKLPISQNGYCYANSNPINLSDPAGLWTIDINGQFGIPGAGLTSGWLISDKGIYSYAGLGVASPGLGGGVFYSPDDPEPGISTQGGGGAIVGFSASRAYPNGDYSWEYGLTTPGAGVYTVKTTPLICF